MAARTAFAPKAAPLRARRAGRLVAVGAVPGLLRGSRLGRPCPQPSEPLLVPDGGSHDAVVRIVYRRCRSGHRPTWRGRRRHWACHGWTAGAQGSRGPPDRGNGPALPGTARRAPPAGPAPRAARTGQRATGRLARRAIRALRSALALRAGPWRAQPRASGGCNSDIPRGKQALEPSPPIATPGRPLVSSRAVRGPAPSGKLGTTALLAAFV